MVSEDVKQHERLKKKRETCTQRCGREGCNDDDDVEPNVLGCRVDILGTNCDQCLSMVQCCFTSTETVRLIRTGSPGRPPRLSLTQLLNSGRLHKTQKNDLKTRDCTILF